MNIFLDTNVVIDYLSGREPFCSDVRPEDFEDAVQHYTAISGKADVIITRNVSDFIPYNKLEVLTPKEFLAKYQI